MESLSTGNERAELILIPGLLNDADLCADQVLGLSGIATCQVADITKGTTLRGLAEGVLANAPERFALAGFSLGGYVAQEVTRIAPEGSVAALKLALPKLRHEGVARGWW
jgi:pimeloyl-ACP methyl ester carboxylesterase